MATVPVVSVIDFTDPCAALDIVKARYYSVLAGGQPERIQFGDRSVVYTAANIAGLEKLIARLEVECGLKNGRPRRFAIGSGGPRLINQSGLGIAVVGANDEPPPEDESP